MSWKNTYANAAALAVAVLSGSVAGTVLAATPPVIAVQPDATDWGAYAILPVSAPGMALELNGKVEAGTAVSIGRSSDRSEQKWRILPAENGLVAIRPVGGSNLALAVEQGGTSNGAHIVLETDTGALWQRWRIQRNSDGSYVLLAAHAPTKGLDDFGGDASPGARQDLWDYSVGDIHLHWLIRPLNGSFSATGAPAEADVYVPPMIDPAAVPRGTIKSFPFVESRVFPGTQRDVTVFIPAQYDGSHPACVFVKTDGYNAHEKDLVETAIAAGEMPVTVAVFVSPGNLPAPMKDTLGRRNRSLEYDGLGDANERFLDEELLPYVAKTLRLNLSTRGADRCIAGGSSGGIAAFTAAWDHPDKFSRVYASSPSFVAFRGGDAYPALVRKSEARPIRAFITTATNDMENAAGDWYLLDQEIDKALKFSGYDYQFRIINGGHVAGYGEHFREAMAYLWKEWPAAVPAGPSAPRVQDVILPGEDWNPTASGLGTNGGLAANGAGDVFCVDSAKNRVIRIDGALGKITTLVADAQHATCLAVSKAGDLLTGSPVTGKLLRYDTAGKVFVVRSGLFASTILADPFGGIYAGVIASGKHTTGAVVYVKDGKESVCYSGLMHPTGLAYRADQWLLAVADRGAALVDSYQMSPSGTLTNRESYYVPMTSLDGREGATEGLCFVREGQLVAATRLGVQVFADDGPGQVILPLPDRTPVRAVCLGGKERDILYALSADGKLWQRKIRLHGIDASTPWQGVNASPL